MEVKTQKQEPLISAGRAASLLGTTIHTLANWRATGRYSLPYVKVGRCVRYRLSDIEAFIEAGTVAPRNSDKE